MNDPSKTVAPSPGDAKSPVVDAAPSDQPRHIGRYRIEKVLGEGGFGRVYLAHDDQLNRAVAIKVPRPERLSRPEDAAEYLAEARVLASLDHPNIVPIFDVGTTPLGLCYVVSKVIEGSDLAKKSRQARLSHTETAGLIATVAEALHYAHRKGLVHRDIKPANILIDTSDKPYVADFGLALKEEDFGKGAAFAGTPAYMSPEQARGEGHRVDGRSDIFSLGVVFYELLAGRRPFKADSKQELLEQITKVEARPPRQVDDHIPKELERICLKALAKRASERYTTAKDMADDLRHFLEAGVRNQGSGISSQESAVRETEKATGTPSPLTPDSWPLTPVPKIVPKGLRSFDAHDADFFLELLPGPRDRDGLPDSIRFWKTRIEATDSDNTFSVGLIYGPSGCGKSSLVKAGLLPRLSDDLIVVYVEATAEDTETRLLKGLRKHCPDLPENLSVIETLAALRRGHYLPAGKKVVLVLDQFEQWLHAKAGDANTELVQALRHCDGERLQCIVMVRDDFGMAATRFMGALDIPIVQGHNFATVDLFDLLHSRKVLAEFGRAFGRLPDCSRIPQNAGDVNPHSGECGYPTKEQEAFLDQAVSGLAQEGKVISVRLALFAEMVKGKPWTPATLLEVGGMEGVGVTFLEETFTARAAPPQHRLHQKSAQAVLKALLPDIGTDIKGNMRSQQELLAVSGYAGQPKDFDALLRILDGELRLITPTDPEGVEHEAPGRDGQARLPVLRGDPAVVGQAALPVRPAPVRFYQLTHDYLVPSLRDWLTRKQKETRRGRAELLLADRAAVWNARQENRQLPSLLQWFNIRCWTRKKNWSPPQRKMMRKAGRYHAVRGAALALLLAVATTTGLVIREQVEEQRRANQAAELAIREQAEEQRKATHAAGLVQAVLNANTPQVPGVVREMAEYRKWADPLLHEEYDKAAANSRQKLHVSLALLPVDPGQVDYLYGRLLDAEPHEVPVIRDALAPHREALHDKLWTVVEMPGKGKESQRLRAASALAKYDPENQKWAKAGALVANDLVLENPVFLGHWSEGFRPIRQRLLSPLSAIFRDHNSEKGAERTLATNLLADYAADQPQVLADLLMDANEKQFARLYPLVEKHSVRSISELVVEIDKEVLIAKDKIVFESKGEIADSDLKVKRSLGAAMPAKRFEVPLEGGKNYRLTMESKELDSFLVLEDKTGKELAFDDDGGGNLNSLLTFTAPMDDRYTVFAASFQGTGSFQLRIVERFAGDDGKEQLAKRQANAAVALLKMNQPEKVWPLLKHSPDPRVRSYLIHRLAPLGVDAGAIVKRLDKEPDVTIRRALLLSLGEFGEKELSLDERKALLPKLREMYRAATDPGLHASAEWLLRQWKEEAWLKQMNEEWAKDKERRETARRAALAPGASPRWYVNSQGQTMVVIPGPVEFLMGSPTTEADRRDDESQHKKRIGRTFALAAKAVTMEQYQKFDKGYRIDAKYHRTADLPVVGTSWYQAAAYCNWLSKEEGIDEDQRCYEIEGKVMKLKANYLSLTGYRLPTEAEIEYATRAGAVTSRYFGETDELLPRYAWYVKNAQEMTWPVGSLKPNDLGLFDMQGNAFTWCQESFQLYPTGKGEEAAEDQEDNTVISPTQSRVLRGGSFNYLPSIVRSAYRSNDVPAYRSYNNGFRPARTFTP